MLPLPEFDLKTLILQVSAIRDFSEERGILRMAPELIRASRRKRKVGGSKGGNVAMEKLFDRHAVDFHDLHLVARAPRDLAVPGRNRHHSEPAMLMAGQQITENPTGSCRFECPVTGSEHDDVHA